MNENKKYPEGTDMGQFEHLPEISKYNHNYYKGFDGDMLLAISDDDNTTEWYVLGKNDTTIGVTYTDEGDRYLYK